MFVEKRNVIHYGLLIRSYSIVIMQAILLILMPLLIYLIHFKKYKIRIEDDKGKVYTIRIPNSLYLPDLRRCLLSPQHWAQEAKAMGNKGKTWMENYWDKCILCWKGGKFRKTIRYNESTNTPIFHSSKAYRAFATTFEACRATYFCRENVLQVPGLREHAPEEFIADEERHTGVAGTKIQKPQPQPK
jgi:hypothetical protein